MPGRARPRRAQLAEDRRKGLVEIGRDLVDEAEAQRRRRVEALAGNEVAARRALADFPEGERRDHGRDDSELDLRECENSPLVREGDVGGRHETRTAAHGVSLDDGDHGSGAGVDRLEHPAQGVRLGDVLLAREAHRRPHPVDVGARAEAGALAGQHDGPDGADVDECLGELLDQPAVERIRVPGRARVTRRTSPSRSMRRASMWTAV